MTMASKKNNPKTDPADLTLRVWVIEQRDKGEREWVVFDVRHLISEYHVICICSNLSIDCPGREFRYRAATLTFDDDGRKCTIY